MPAILDFGPLRGDLRAVLDTVDPREKAHQAIAIAKRVREAGAIAPPQGPPAAWALPATRSAPELLPPWEMPKRPLGTQKGRAALLHAIAHIELNAIDLGADIVGRFTHTLPPDQAERFVRDWISVMGDEGRHFLMVADRLVEFETPYGALPAHDGLFQAAERTAHDLLARLAIAPMVLEARGLDVTPGMIKKLTAAGDRTSADILQTIYDEEIPHVAFGVTWFERRCADLSLDAEQAFADMVGTWFPGGLKRPFNTDARDETGMPRCWYEPLVG